MEEIKEINKKVSDIVEIIPYVFKPEFVERSVGLLKSHSVQEVQEYVEYLEKEYQDFCFVYDTSTEKCEKVASELKELIKMTVELLDKQLRIEKGQMSQSEEVKDITDVKYDDCKLALESGYRSKNRIRYTETLRELKSLGMKCGLYKPKLSKNKYQREQKVILDVVKRNIAMMTPKNNKVEDFEKWLEYVGKKLVKNFKAAIIE